MDGSLRHAAPYRNLEADADEIPEIQIWHDGKDVLASAVHRVLPLWTRMGEHGLLSPHRFRQQFDLGYLLLQCGHIEWAQFS